MSKRWAAIVYGRTYHLDFRFITVPHNFDAEDLSWASQHIVATTQQARHLNGSPRWSLFKNKDFCIVGVTATVKDLIGDTVRDNQGRPLYIFVGYVAQLSPQQKIENLPAYSASLNNFKILYQQIEPVWSIRNYDPKSRYPAASQYYPIAFQNTEVPSLDDGVPVLNQSSKQPDKIYLWPNIERQNKLLWQASVRCQESTSICLNIRGKALLDSPFLNLSSSQTQQFQTLDRISDRHQSYSTSTNNSDFQPDPSLSQKISNRAKDDLDLTLQQATKMALASQELIGNLSDWNYNKIETEELDSTIDDPEFGFKTKKTSPDKQDWF